MVSSHRQRTSSCKASSRCASTIRSTAWISERLTSSPGRFKTCSKASLAGRVSRGDDPQRPGGLGEVHGDLLGQIRGQQGQTQGEVGHATPSPPFGHGFGARVRVLFLLTSLTGITWLYATPADHTTPHLGRVGRVPPDE